MLIIGARVLGLWHFGSLDTISQKLVFTLQTPNLVTLYSLKHFIEGSTEYGINTNKSFFKKIEWFLAKFEGLFSENYKKA